MVAGAWLGPGTGAGVVGFIWEEAAGLMGSGIVILSDFFPLGLDSLLFRWRFAGGIPTAVIVVTDCKPGWVGGTGKVTALEDGVVEPVPLMLLSVTPPSFAAFRFRF